MKRSRIAGGLILGMAAVASAVLFYESTCSRANVYSLGIYAGGYTGWGGASVSWPIKCGYEQYTLGWWNDPRPRLSYTDIYVGSHRLSLRTPYYLIGSPKLNA